MKIKELTDDELKAKEQRLRHRLPKTDNRSDLYANLYKQWFYLREAGVGRGLFRFFVSTRYE